MTTAQELKLLLIAEKLRITVEMDTQGVLNDDDLGGWFPQHKLILLRPGLSQANLLHTLAHELGHAIHNHIGEHHPRQERKVDEFAAQILISKDDYIRAEEMAGGHIPWVAHPSRIHTSPVIAISSAAGTTRARRGEVTSTRIPARDSSGERRIIATLGGSHRRRQRSAVPCCRLR